MTGKSTGGFRGGFHRECGTPWNQHGRSGKCPDQPGGDFEEALRVRPHDHTIFPDPEDDDGSYAGDFADLEPSPGVAALFDDPDTYLED